MALITVSPSLGGDKGENVEGDGKTKEHLKREPNEINRSDGHLFSGCETLSQSGGKKKKTKPKEKCHESGHGVIFHQRNGHLEKQQTRFQT